MSLKLNWEQYYSYDAVKDIEMCIYVFRAGDEVLYVGKAKKFGVRYSAGYKYLITALLQAGHQLYVAPISKELWLEVINIEQTLIDAWDPITDQKRIKNKKYDICCDLPWDNTF